MVLFVLLTVLNDCFSHFEHAAKREYTQKYAGISLPVAFKFFLLRFEFKSRCRLLGRWTKNTPYYLSVPSCTLVRVSGVRTMRQQVITPLVLE